MTSFVFCHFMNGVMDSVEVELFSKGCDFFLACASALFSSSTHFEVGLGVVRNDFAEEFSEFSSVFSFFESDAFVGFSDFRIALAVSDTAHSEVHADFGAFACEVEVEAFEDAFVDAFSDAYAMFVSVFFDTSDEFREFFFRSAALRTLFRSFRTFINKTSDTAYKFFHPSFLLIL